ncbi:MAG TPA: flagellin, partial [Limnobacter sp.]|nr:flagellin [Limnobacter sp.]
YTFKFGDVDVQLAVTGTTPAFTKATYNSANSISGTDGSAARTALTKIATFLDQVSQQRATFGAGINRLDSIINNLDTSITATSAARGRIIDTDFARETANLTRAQILQQAGTSVLAQANQLPSSVLSLLG